MALEQVLSDRDSEDEVDDDVADFEDRRVCFRIWHIHRFSLLSFYSDVLDIKLSSLVDICFVWKGKEYWRLGMGKRFIDRKYVSKPHGSIWNSRPK